MLLLKALCKYYVVFFGLKNAALLFAKFELEQQWAIFKQKKSDGATKPM